MHTWEISNLILLFVFALKKGNICNLGGSLAKKLSRLIEIVGSCGKSNGLGSW